MVTPYKFFDGVLTEFFLRRMMRMLVIFEADVEAWLKQKDDVNTQPLPESSTKRPIDLLNTRQFESGISVDGENGDYNFRDTTNPNATAKV